METSKPLLKDEDGKEVDVDMYRSMIGSLMYLTSSRPDIMFVGQPKLGIWYLKDSPFDLVAYKDNDYAGASLDRKSTTEGCQFLRCRLISWQCKKQTVFANSTIEAEYVAALSCCGQVLWIQNQLLDYGKKIKDKCWFDEIDASAVQLLLNDVVLDTKVNVASEYGYYCLKSMFEETLQLLVNADINTKTAQAKEIANLKNKVKKLERKRRFRTPGINLFKIGTNRKRSLGEDDASKQERDLKQRSIREEFETEGRIVRIKRLLNAVEVNAAAKVNAASEYGYY
nr:uncharacterized mitochondrial protein AtMg00810-like [Tanacetum cinerariifolium]